MSERSTVSRDGPDAPDSAAPASSRTAAWLMRAAELQIRRPIAVLALAVLLVAVSLSQALGLEVRPGFAALLPENRPSVRELDRVKERTAGVSTVFVVLEGDDTRALRDAGDALVGKLGALGPPWVGSAESGVQEAFAFLRPRAGLYLELEELQKLHDDLDERYQYEVGKATGATLDLDDDYEPPKIDPETLKQRFAKTEGQVDRYPDGYYQSADGKTVVVALRSAVLATEYDQATEALRVIRGTVAEVDPRRFHPSIRWGLTGDLVTGLNEYKAINDDLTDVGLLGAGLLVGVVFLFYLRFRTLIAMILTVSIGVAVTFGVSKSLVGHLNMATGFLFTIIAGNGINSGIMYMARYLEARRGGAGAPSAIRLAHRETWVPTLTAALAASAAYVSLIVTEFRGFRDFGAIGGAGMIICWLCTYAFLPSILVVIERIAPMKSERTGLFGLLPRFTLAGTRFGEPFAALVSRAPRVCTLASIALAIAGGVLTVAYVQRDPMEYDLKNLRTDMSKRLEEERLSDLADAVTGYVGSDGMAMLVERREQVPLLETELLARRDRAPAGEKPFHDVHALQDFVPDQQAEKIPLLLTIRDRLMRSRERGFIEDEDWNKLEPLLPPKALAPFGIDDLPAGMARTFTERDGTRGRIVYISPIDLVAIDDAHYLFRWADSYRRVDLPDGSTVIGSGRAVIYAEIWEAVIADVPKAVLVSLVMTLLVVLLAFRRSKVALAAMLALLCGLVWMTGLMAVMDLKINFLNFIALPLTFGIGVDYAVNVLQRYRREGAGGALTAVRETGGAVVLCSATTALGYFALTGSDNYAVRSLGIAAVVGEIACLIAAVIALPAALVWIDGRRTKWHTSARDVTSHFE